MTVDRRQFVLASGKYLIMSAAASRAVGYVLAGSPERAPGYSAHNHWWAMAVDVDLCIGCGGCVRACKEENDVPLEPFFFRTWVERYHVPEGDIEHPMVDSPNGGYDGFPERYREGDGSKNFFVPKLCNHCAHSPCVQVCTVACSCARLSQDSCVTSVIVGDLHGASVATFRLLRITSPTRSAGGSRM